MTGNTLQCHGDRSVAPTGQTGESTVAAGVDGLSEAVLDALGDEYTRTVLAAILGQPRSGREVAEVTSVSKATAFRRLNELADLGLVTVEQHVDPASGHHHKRYRAVVESVTVTFDGGELDVELTAGPQDDSRVSNTEPPK